LAASSRAIPVGLGCFARGELRWPFAAKSDPSLAPHRPELSAANQPRPPAVKTACVVGSGPNLSGLSRATSSESRVRGPSAALIMKPEVVFGTVSAFPFSKTKSMTPVITEA
jgi:hypothetical protein